MSLPLDMAVPTHPTPGTQPWTVRAEGSLRDTEHVAHHPFLMGGGLAQRSQKAEPAQRLLCVLIAIPGSGKEGEAV